MATGGRAHNMERFAFDIFEFTMSRFNIDAVVPKPRSSENNYEYPDFHLIISAGYISYQLQSRDILKSKFVTTYKSNRLRKFKQISELLEELFEKMECTMPHPFQRLINSIALINELIQFLHSKNCQLFLNDLAGLWRDYFARFQEEFEGRGGLSLFYITLKTEPFRILEEIVVDFIPKYCLPYGKRGIQISTLFIEECSGSMFMHSLNKTVMHNLDKIDLSALDSRFKEKLSVSSRSPRKSGGEKTRVCDVLVNTALAIRQHEEPIRDSYSLSVDEYTFSKKCDTESCIKGASAAADADEKLHRKFLEQPSGEQVKGRKELSTQIASPEWQSKERVDLARSFLNPEGQSKDRGSFTRSPLRPEGQSEDRGSLARSFLCPEEQSKDRGSLIRSPLSPEGQSKGRGGLAGSPASPQEQKLHQDSRDSPSTPKGISRLEQKRLKYLQSKKN